MSWKTEAFRAALYRLFKAHKVTFKIEELQVGNVENGYKLEEAVFFVVDGEPDYSASITEIIADMIDDHE